MCVGKLFIIYLSAYIYVSVCAKQNGGNLTCLLSFSTKKRKLRKNENINKIQLSKTACN